MNSGPVPFIDKLIYHGVNCYSVAMRVLGVILVLAFYLLMSMECYAFFGIIVPLLKKRLGTYLGLVWIVVGLSLLYNLIWNHILAVCVKPGSVSDLKWIEEERRQQ